MKPKLIISLVAGVLVAGGGVWAYQSHQAQVKMDHDAAMVREADHKAPSAMTEDKAMMLKGSFTDYDPAKLANAEKGKVVLFFSAPWCPTCREANKNFNASATPGGLTLLKLDYDSSTELKRKYGVTYQHTYVQVDKDGNQIKKWSGSKNYAELEAELKS